jgi:hypothetical protein
MNKVLWFSIYRVDALHETRVLFTRQNGLAKYYLPGPRSLERVRRLMTGLVHIHASRFGLEVEKRVTE